jgi:thiol-disulfide isomerase/thioredoxin
VVALLISYRLSKRLNFKGKILLILFGLYPAILWSQDVKSILTKVGNVNSKLTSGKYDFVSKIKAFGSTDTICDTSEVVFQMRGNHTLCRVYDKKEKHIYLYDTGQFKTRIDLNDSNIYISLRNSPEADHVLYDNTRPFYLANFQATKIPWTIESETDSSFIILSTHNPDPQTIHKCWSRLHIDKKTYILYWSIDYLEIIDPGVDTSIQYKEQTISNFRFNLPQLEFDLLFKQDSDFHYKRIVQFHGNEEPIIDPNTINNNIAHLKLTAMNGEVIDFGKTNSKLIILDFYYSGCMLAHPAMHKIHKKYKNRGIQIVGINPIDKDSIRIQKMLKAKKVEYNTCLNVAELAKSYKVTTYPTILIFNSDKELVKRITGYSTNMDAEVTEIIENMLR